VSPWPFDQKIYDSIQKTYGASLKDALDTEKHPKKESYKLIDELKAKIVETVPEEDEEKLTLTKRAFDKLKEDIFRDEILNNRSRLRMDERSTIRDLRGGYSKSRRGKYLLSACRMPAW